MLQGGPLLVLNGAITLINGFISRFAWGKKTLQIVVKSPLITSRGPSCMFYDIFFVMIELDNSSVASSLKLIPICRYVSQD